MAKILSVPERIKLLKEINRLHKEIYGWKMVYNSVRTIDVERDHIERLDGWVPMSESDAAKYYFHDSKGGDITLLQGIFSWQGYNFYHINPYKFVDHYHPKPGSFSSQILSEDDIISDNFGRRIRSDINHLVECLETWIAVQQRKEDGKIWISTTWLYPEDCYSPASPFAEAVCDALEKTAKQDEEAFKKLWQRYEEFMLADRKKFEMGLEGYFKGEGLHGKHWHGGYVFAASKEWKIKTLQDLSSVAEVEDKHFQSSLEEFLLHIRNKGFHLNEEAEEFLRNRVREIYAAYPSGLARDLMMHLVEEDKAQPSDVYLWWGGEPNVDCCYALLTLFFEMDPQDIGTSKFDKKISRDLRAIINIAEKEYALLSSDREYQPHIWKAVFS